jgi:hypothetical protein
MLGRFLELALLTEDTSTSWQDWQSLGFAAASTGDIWPHPYGVVTCQGLAIGLHAAGEESPSLVFVRPEVAALHRELQGLGIEVEHARLGSDVFNELMLREPGGMPVRVLESRSFSPPLENPSQTALGRFNTLTLPARDLDGAREFWEGLGFACQPSTLPEWPEKSFALAGTPVSIHPRRLLAEPALLFRQHSGDITTAGAALGQAGITAEKPRAGLPGGARLLRTREGLALLLIA